jgi:hypothetical protein
MASGGVGSGNHLSGELFKIMAGVNMIHVPYRGEAPALADMLGGQVQVIFGSMPGTIEYIRSGRLRPLAVTSATRSEALPDIPTVGDFVPKCYRPNDSRACAVKQHSGAPLSAKGFFGHCQTPLGLDQRRATSSALRLTKAPSSNALAKWRRRARQGSAAWPSGRWTGPGLPRWAPGAPGAWAGFLGAGQARPLPAADRIPR